MNLLCVYFPTNNSECDLCFVYKQFLRTQSPFLRHSLYEYVLLFSFEWAARMFLCRLLFSQSDVSIKPADISTDHTNAKNNHDGNENRNDVQLTLVWAGLIKALSNTTTHTYRYNSTSNYFAALYHYCCYSECTVGTHVVLRACCKNPYLPTISSVNTHTFLMSDTLMTPFESGLRNSFSIMN